MCVDGKGGERGRETHFYSSTGAHIYKREYKPSCGRLQKRPSVTLQLEAIVDRKKKTAITTRTISCLKIGISFYSYKKKSKSCDVLGRVKHILLANLS